MYLIYWHNKLRKRTPYEPAWLSAVLEKDWRRRGAAPDLCYVVRVLVMGRRPCTFKEADFTRAVKAARKAGLEIAGVKVSREGDITIVAGKPSEANDARQAETEKDEWNTDVIQ